MMFDIRPGKVAGEWLFMQTIKTRTTALSGSHHMSVQRGRRAFDA
jgi:alkaline phosphatase D